MVIETGVITKQRILIIGGGAMGSLIAATLAKVGAVGVILPSEQEKRQPTEAGIESKSPDERQKVLVVDEHSIDDALALAMMAPPVPSWDEPDWNLRACASPWGYWDRRNEELRAARRECLHDAMNRERERRANSNLRTWRRYETQASMHHERLRLRRGQ